MCLESGGWVYPGVGAQVTRLGPICLPGTQSWRGWPPPGMRSQAAKLRLGRLGAKWHLVKPSVLPVVVLKGAQVGLAQTATPTGTPKNTVWDRLGYRSYIGWDGGGSQ